MSIVSIITHLPQILQSAIYFISTSLLYPVIIALLGLTLWLVTEIGVFTVEYLTRTGRLSKNPEDIETGIIEAKSMVEDGGFREGIDLLNRSTSSRFVYIFLDGLLAIKEKEIELDNPGTYKKLFSVNLEKLLQKCDLLISKRLEKSKAMIRLGPMFGLMGTLIPMGPALIGLSSGNIQQLAANLVIAFSTTVLGLLAGAVAYCILLVKKKWYTQDLSDMEYVVEVLK